MKKVIFGLTMFVSAISRLVEGVEAHAWTSFRDGGIGSSREAVVPLEWSPEKGILWQIETRGYGQSSPLLWNDFIYITYVDGPYKDLSVVAAIDLTTGLVRWEYEFPTSQTDSSWYAESRAAPTPVIDKDGIYSFFEGGDLLAIDHRGTLKWHRSLTKDYGEIDSGHGLGASLAQSDEAVFVLVEHQGPSYLLSIDKESGRNLWKTERSTGISWASPIVAELQGRRQIIVSSNGSVIGYDASDGSIIWSHDKVVGNTMASVTVKDNQVFVGAKGDSGTFCLEFTADSKLGTYRKIWENVEAVCNYASPLVWEENVYIVDSRGFVHCLNRYDGKHRFEEKLSDVCWATPFVADGHVLFFSKNGVGTVIKGTTNYDEISTNHLWDLENPPYPESYVQNPPESSSSSPSFIDRLNKSDQDGDGLVVPAELHSSLKRSFSRLDENEDGVIDKNEIAKVADRIRANSASNVFDDPIVYGSIVGKRSIIVRTGTRLYNISTR